MKNLFLKFSLVFCLLLTVEAVEAQTQSVTEKPAITRGDGKAWTVDKQNKNVASSTTQTPVTKSTAVATTTPKPAITLGDGKTFATNKQNKNVTSSTTQTPVAKSTAVATTTPKPAITLGDGKTLTANKPNKNAVALTTQLTAAQKLDKNNCNVYLNAKTNAEKKQILQKWATETTSPNIQKRIQSMLSKLPN